MKLNPIYFLRLKPYVSVPFERTLKVIHKGNVEKCVQLLVPVFDAHNVKTVTPEKWVFVRHRPFQSCPLWQREIGEVTVTPFYEDHYIRDLYITEEEELRMLTEMCDDA